MKNWAEETLGGMGASKYYRRVMAGDMCPEEMVKALRAVAKKNKWVVEVKKRRGSVMVKVLTKAKPPAQKKPSMSMRIKEIMESIPPRSRHEFISDCQTELESARRAVYVHNKDGEFSTTLDYGVLLIIRG